jgi:cell division protein FtsB
MKRFNILLIVLFLSFSFNLLSGCERGIKKEDYEMLKTELQKVRGEMSDLEKKNQELANELSDLKDENQRLLAENEQLKSMQAETEPMESPTPEPSVTPVPEDE